MNFPLVFLKWLLNLSKKLLLTFQTKDDGKISDTLHKLCKQIKVRLIISLFSNECNLILKTYTLLSNDTQIVL